MPKKPDDPWTCKLNYLVREELPQRVSRGLIPENCRGQFDVIDTVGRLADAVNYNRTSLYAKPRPQLWAEIRHLYRIPNDGDCKAELEIGSYEDFVKEFRALHEDFEDDQTPPPPPPPERRTDLPLEVAHSEFWSYDDQLASLELKAFQTGVGTASLGCTVNCQITELDSHRVQVKRGKLTLNPGKASFKANSPVDSPGVAKTIQERRATVTKCSPVSWIVEASSGVIGEIDIPPDGNVIDVINLAPGDTLTGTYSTYLKEVTTGANCCKQNAADGIVKEGMKPLGRAKQAVLDLLAAQRLPEGDGGRVKLCAASITFKERV